MMILKQRSVTRDAAPPGSSLRQRGSHVRTSRAARDARLSRLPSLAMRLAVTVHGHLSEAGNCDDLWIGPVGHGGRSTTSWRVTCSSQRVRARRAVSSTYPRDPGRIFLQRSANASARDHAANLAGVGPLLPT